MLRFYVSGRQKRFRSSAAFHFFIRKTPNHASAFFPVRNRGSSDAVGGRRDRRNEDYVNT